MILPVTASLTWFPKNVTFPASPEALRHESVWSVVTSTSNRRARLSRGDGYGLPKLSRPLLSSTAVVKLVSLLMKLRFVNSAIPRPSPVVQKSRSRWSAGEGYPVDVRDVNLALTRSSNRLGVPNG